MERMEREYLPLTGEELLKITLAEAGRQLAEYNQYFGGHLAYHNPLIRLAVKVECFTPERTPTDGGFELALSLTKGPIMEPDRVREECGLGTYETKLVDEPTGTLADVKVDQRGPFPDPKETLDKIDKLLGERDETVEKPPIKKKVAKKSKKRSGWPKGKPRGPRPVTSPINKDTPTVAGGV